MSVRTGLLTWAIAMGACGAAPPVAPSAVLPAAFSDSALASSEPSEVRGIVEALFFGTGPLAEVGNPGCDSTLERMRGWPRGSRVRVVAYGSLDEERRDAVKRTLRQADQAFASALRTEFEVRQDVPEPAGTPDGEVSVIGAAAIRVPALCGMEAANCQVVQYRSGAYFASRVILSTPFTDASSRVMAHELGHAFGLCHIDPARGGLDPQLSAMGRAGTDGWTSVDLDAIRRVYAAGLSPADHRQRFVAAGLIN